MDFWRRKRQETLEGGDNGAGGEKPRSRTGRGTALAVRPIPEEALILVPLRSAVLFPGIITPLAVGRGSSVAAVQEAARQGRKAGFLLQRDPKTDQVGADDLHWVGTAGEIVRYVPAAEGVHHLAVQGQSRFRVTEFLEGWPFLVARVVWVPEATEGGEEIEARFLQLKAQAVEAIKLLPNVPDELAGAVQAIDSASQLADMVANLLDIENEEKQAVLEAFDLKQRLDLVLAHLAERVSVLRLSKEIGDKTKKEFDERQREHVLREQMRQIQ
ncbi:MAG: LON peptidase substrate-binding domain-containing protein, partial [Burkholderiales bacterium]